MRLSFFISIILCSQLAFSQLTEMLVPFESDKKWGYMSAEKKIVIPAIYDYALPFQNGIAQVCRDQKCGIIDKNNKVLISFDEQMYFQVTNDLFITKLMKEDNTRSGVINTEKKTLIPFDYDMITFDNGFFSLHKDNKDGIADTNGKIIIETVYDNVNYAGNNSYIVTKNNSQALFDLNGKQLTGFKYMVIADFRNNLAKARVGDLFGFLNTQGHEVIPFIYEMGYSFSGGYAVVRKDKKYGLIDSVGKTIIQPKYDDMNDVHLGVASVKLANKWGLVDHRGKEITKIEFDEIKREYNGVIAAKKDNKWAIMDPKGQLLTGFVFDTIKIHEGNESVLRQLRMLETEVDRGYLLVSINKKWGVVDINGKTIISPQYDDVYPFTHGVAFVEKEGRHALVDLKGNLKTEFIYDGFESYIAGTHNLKKFGIILYYKNNLVGIMDTSGKEITPPIYDDIRPSDDNYYRVLKNKKVGVIDSKGTEIIPVKYDGIRTQPIPFSFDDVIFKDGLCFVIKGSATGYVDKQGIEYFK